MESLAVPTMSPNYIMYLSQDFESKDEIGFYREYFESEVAQLREQCESLGLRRGVHYSVKPRSNHEMSELMFNGLVFPCTVMLGEINFRNKRAFDTYMASGFAGYFEMI